MALKNLYDMVKADRYTADGREAIIKAQEAETEDATRRTYQIGEISQKTGLQKTANGWVKPKNGKQPGAKQEEPKNVHGAEVDKIYERQLKRIKELKAKGFTDEQIDNDKIIKQTKEDMKNVGKKPGSKPATKSENKTTIRQGPNTKTLNETPAEHVQKNLDAYKGYSPYDMEELVLKPSGYEKQTSARVPGGGQSITYTKNGAEDITLFFDKNGELENADVAGSKPAAQEEIGKFYTKFKDAQSAYDAGRQTFTDGGYKIYNTPQGYKVVDDPKIQQRMEAAGYEIEADVPEGTKPPKGPGEKPAAPRREAVSAGRMMKDLDGNFWSRPEDFKEDITSRGWDVDEMTNEYAVISNEAGSQYEVRFDDHSDDGDLTVRNFKALQIDEDDDDDSLEDAAPSLSEIVDRVYNIGEISEKTGLQKTAQGWRPVKKGAAASRANKEEAIRKDLGLTAGEDMSRFSDEQIEKMYAKTQQIPEQQKADFDKSKIGQAVNKGRQEFAAEKTRQKELASKTNAIGLPKENKPGAGIPTYKESDFIGKTYGDFAKTLPRGQYTITRNQENPDGSSENDFTDIKHGGKKITVKFDKEGKITSVKQHENPTRSYQVGASNQATETKPAESKPAAAPKLNQVEKVDGANRPYRIKGTQFYFETPEEAETAIVAGTRGEGKTYAKPSSDATINEIQNALGFKLDSEYAGKYSMDDFMKKTGKDEYGVKVWSFGTDSKGTLIDTIVEGYNKPNATIKKENGEWRLHYTDRDGKKMIVTPKGREWPTSDSAPRQLTGDCRIRIRKEKPALTGDTKIRVRK